MINEYAVDIDEAFSNLASIQRFLTEFGADKGRVVGAVPHKWADEAIRKANSILQQPIEKSRCKEKIKHIARYSLITCDGMGIGSQSWIDKAKELNATFIFAGILTNHSVPEQKIYSYFNLLLNQPDGWEIEQTKSVPRNAVDLSSAISTSLNLAKNAILFAEPHFDANKTRFVAPFIEFIKIINNSNRFKLKKVFLHTCINLTKHPRRDRDFIKEAMKSHLQSKLPKDFVVEVWLWEKNAFHDRFVLTKNVGYAYGHGLDENTYSNAVEVNINRLGETERAKQFTYFSTEANRKGQAFTIIGE